MFEKILENLYRIEIPLPGSPLKALNSYVIKGTDRSLIVDTGWNQEDCREALISGLKGIGVNLKEADFFITHMHADHFGLVSNLATVGSRVNYSKRYSATMNSEPGYWEKQSEFACRHGFTRDDIEVAIESHPGRRYKSKEISGLYALGDGDTIRVGDYLFECIETPGHTKEHMCLYESSKKILIAGDHILHDITPNITLWSDEQNTLNEYLMSLNKVYNLDVELVLPGHRSIFRDHRERIRELKQHHEERLNEVISILKNGRRSAFLVASQMMWGIVCESWELFPLQQKWFAFGEAMAHLKYLEERGIIEREIDGQGVIFSMAKSGQVGNKLMREK